MDRAARNKRIKTVTLSQVARERLIQLAGERKLNDSETTEAAIMALPTKAQLRSAAHDERACSIRVDQLMANLTLNFEAMAGVIVWWKASLIKIAMRLGHTGEIKDQVVWDTLGGMDGEKGEAAAADYAALQFPKDLTELHATLQGQVANAAGNGGGNGRKDARQKAPNSPRKARKPAEKAEKRAKTE